MTKELQETINKVSNFLSVKSASAKYSVFSEGAFRHMIFLNKYGFADKVVIRVGRKILLKEDSLISFLNDFNKGDEVWKN